MIPAFQHRTYIASVFDILIKTMIQNNDVDIRKYVS